MTGAVRTLHVVAKSHLDLGFTGLAAEVRDRYLDGYFPAAMATAEELRAAGGPERLVWTTGSWILQQALDAGVPGLADAVAAGDIAWHALPLTFHTGLLDADLVRSGLAISRALDARFGRTTTAAKMTDVPGHTRALVPLLAEAGVTFLHLGVNPAWPVPEVPPAFRWRSPDGAEVAVAYQAGGYGGDVVVPGCPDALAFLHAGDNLGPPSAVDVVAAHAELARRYPGAEVRGSTLDAFARALAASGAVAGLPVVTAEVGDPWVFGAGSDPSKVAVYRDLLRARRSAPPAAQAEADRSLLLVPEHTWGLDQKEALPDAVRWDRAGLAELRATAAGRRFESSWVEQRAYVDEAARALGRPTVAERGAAVATGVAAWAADAPGRSPVGAGSALDVGGWRLALGPAGEAVGLVAPDGSAPADADHPMGLLRYQSFDEADYERFYAGLSPTPEDEWWARWDNTKPGIDAAGAVSDWFVPTFVGAWQRAAGDEVLARVRFEGVAAERLGAPPEAWLRWGPGVDGALDLVVAWADKPANRLPEALWCSFVPVVAEPERWRFDVLGQPVSPLDVVRRGGRALHAVGEGMAYDGPDGRLEIATPDAPLVAPGEPRLLDADPPVPDLAGGLHVLLHDNCWGTNFPMWWEGPARFAFTIRSAGPRPS
ncbi:MAG: DUF5054 domain-containing protein [Acidimicrobiales bacterium]